MIEIQRLQPKNAVAIAAWCRDKNEDFLTQWAGGGYDYPLTEKQILDRLKTGAAFCLSTTVFRLADTASGSFCRWCGAERQRAGKNKAEAADP